MQPTKGYLVKYGRGEWEDYREHDVAVYTDKAKAKKRCKEVDKHHFKRKTEFKKGDLSWETLEDTFWEYKEKNEHLFKRELQFPGHDEQDDKIWKAYNKQERYNNKLFYKLQEDWVMLHYPTWDREKTKEQIKLANELNSFSYNSITEAWIEEIELFM